MQRERTIIDALAHIAKGVDLLQKTFPNRSFTMDGRLVGDIGEVIAALRYDIVLDEVQQSRHDGETSSGAKVQVKATFKNDLTIREVPEFYLGFKLSLDGGHEEIFNGPGSVIERHFGHRAGFGVKLLPIPITTLRKLSATVPPHLRIPKRELPIE